MSLKNKIKNTKVQENFIPVPLSRQLTTNKWFAAEEFMKDQPQQTSIMTVEIFYDHKGSDTIFAMNKDKQGLLTKSFTVPHRIALNHTYGPEEYQQWLKKKSHENNNCI